MRRLLLFMIATGLGTISLADKPELKPYGFIKGDMYLSTGNTETWGHLGNTATTQATDNDTALVSFSAAHTRFGLNGSMDAGNATIGGKLELDFFSTASNTNANAHPRMRQAYSWCEFSNGVTIRAGQQWDVFSPLNPTTNNTNANLWYTGNYGFRRPQFQAAYSIDAGSVTPDVVLSIGEGAKEAAAGDARQDNKSLTPMFQGHAGLTFAENMSVGFGGVLARFKQDESITTYGISVDAHLPFHQYIAMKGEFGYGNNFNNANIFTIGGSAHNNETDVTNIGFWINAVSKPLDHLHLVGGIGLETVSSDLDDGDKESNFTAYGDVIIPVAGTFSVALEYQFLQTTMKGDDPIMANIVDISCKVVF